MKHSPRTLYSLCALCALCGEGSSIAATPPAVVEDLARSYVTQRTACIRLQARRDLLRDAIQAPRPRNGRDDDSVRLLQNSALEFNAVCAAAERDWLAARVEVWNAELARFDRSLEIRDHGTTAQVLYWTDRIVWWAGPPLCILLIVALIYDTRHRLRRMLGAYAGLTVVLFLGAAILGTAGGMSAMLRNPIRATATEPVESPAERFNSEIAAATRERSDLQSEVDQLQQDLADQQSGDNAVRKASRDLAESAALHAFLVKTRRADVETAADLLAQATASADQATSARLVRASGGLGLCLVALSGGWLRIRTARRRRLRRTTTCPACSQRGMRVDRRTGVARCSVAACNFDLSIAHAQSPRLRIAVLGPPGSGKTHWLAAATRELTAGHYSVRGSTTPSAATTALEQINGAILDERRPPPPTPATSLPVPIVLRDRDPFGRSDVLVTVAECGHPAPPHADGYLLTIDATQPMDAHRKWLAELTASRTIGHAAIVFALTKIDLLRGRETDRFFADLAAIEPTGRSTNRSVIRRRSLRTARFVTVLWPGWDAAVDLGRHDVPWFPITPVGLNEPGEPDLRRRVIEPFATLEPLLGLVHACGYPMLM